MYATWERRRQDEPVSLWGAALRGRVGRRMMQSGVLRRARLLGDTLANFRNGSTRDWSEKEKPVSAGALARAAASAAGSVAGGTAER
jgi:hypothetical protein